MARLSLRSNPFFRPGGTPGFDPRHVASANIRFSGVGPSFMNALNGAPPVSFSRLITTDGTLGPSADCGTSTSTGLDISQTNTGGGGTPTQATIAAIARFSDLSTFNGIFADCDSNGVATLFVDNTSNLMMRVAGNNVASSLGMTAGIPYFCAASINQSTGINFLLLRLDTGLLQTQFVSTSQTMPASPAAQRYIISNWEGGNFGMTGKLAAVMYNWTFLSIPQLVQWAQDPWAFWYPRRTLNQIGVTAGGSVGTAAGTGTATAVGASTAASVGTISGVGTASGVGISTATAVASSSGVGVATGVGSSTGGGSTATSVGVATVTGVGAALAAAVGTSSGLGSASGIGFSFAEAIATATGTGTATGVGTSSTVSNVGSASGISIVLGVGASFVEAVGSSSGFGTATGISDSIVGGGKAWRWKEGLQKHHTSKTANSSELDGIRKAAAILSKLGGHARAESLTAKQRTNIASKAANVRWNKR